MIKDNIPSNYITQFHHAISLEDQEFDYTMTVSVFGEVLAVDFLIFDLPKEAQRLMIGKNVDLILEKLKSEARLLKYKIPFLVSNHFIDSTFDQLIDDLRELKFSLGMYEYQVDLNLVNDFWIRDFYLLLSDEKRMGLSKTAKGLNAIADLLSEDPEVFSKSCTQLRISNIGLCSPIVLLLFPRLKKKRNILAAFGLLGAIRNEGSKEFLLKELEKRNRAFTSKIINSLSFYEEKAVHKKMLEYYIKHRGHTDKERISLMKCLKQLDFKLTENILWDLLLGANLEVSVFAFDILKEYDVSNILIKEKLEPLFYNFTKAEELEVVLTLYKKMNDDTIMPKGEDFLDALVKSLLMEEHLKITDLVAWFLTKEHDELVNEKLFGLLDSTEKAVRRSALILIRILFFEYRGNVIHPLPDKVVAKLKKLLNDLSTGVQTEAVKIFNWSGSWSNDREMIPLLLPLIADSFMLKTQVLQTINRFLFILPFDTSILPVYFNALEDPNAKVRIAALEGLKYADSEVVLEKIISMKDDESDAVKNVIKHILKDKQIEVDIKVKKHTLPKTEADVYLRDMYKRMTHEKKFKKIEKEPEEPKDNSLIGRLTRSLKNIFQDTKK